MIWKPEWQENNHPTEFQTLPCPRCGRSNSPRNMFISPRAGRMRWCAHCKILWNLSEIVLDVNEWYEQEYCDSGEDDD